MTSDNESAYIYQNDVMVEAYQTIAHILCAPVNSMEPELAKEKLMFIAGIVTGTEAVLDLIHNAHCKI